MTVPNVGKWGKYDALLRDPLLALCLPKTEWLSPETFRSYLQEYGTAMLKPSGGGGGAGIIQVTALEEDQFEVHAENEKVITVGEQETLDYIQTLMQQTRPYLIQQKIALARLDTRPFDLRVMVRRKPSKPWKVTGSLVKVAGPDYIVTNIKRSGGRVLPLQPVFRKVFTPKLSPKREAEMNQIALRAAHVLGDAYPSLRVIGLDMGIETSGRIWIIEANFRPAPSLFRQLKAEAKLPIRL